jgi:hypothetical protein
LGWHARTDSRWRPASARLCDAAETAFVLEHKPHRSTLFCMGAQVVLDSHAEFFLNPAWRAGLLLG